MRTAMTDIFLSQNNYAEFVLSSKKLLISINALYSLNNNKYKYFIDKF